MTESNEIFLSLNSVKTESIKDILRVPDECPKCGTNMREKEKALNFKFWFKRQKCFGCVLQEEREIKSHWAPEGCHCHTTQALPDTSNRCRYRQVLNGCY